MEAPIPCKPDSPPGGSSLHSGPGLTKERVERELRAQAPSAHHPSPAAPPVPHHASPRRHSAPCAPHFASRLVSRHRHRLDSDPAQISLVPHALHAEVHHPKNSGHQSIKSLWQGPDSADLCPSPNAPGRPVTFAPPGTSVLAIRPPGPSEPAATCQAGFSRARSIQAMSSGTGSGILLTGRRACGHWAIRL